LRSESAFYTDSTSETEPKRESLGKVWVAAAAVVVLAMGLVLEMPLLAGLVIGGGLTIVAISSFPAALTILLAASTGLNYGLLLEYRLQSQGVLTIAVPLSVLDFCAFLAAASLALNLASSRRRAAIPGYLILPLWLFCGATALGTMYGLINGNSVYSLAKDLRVQMYFLLGLVGTATLAANRAYLRTLVIALTAAALSVSFQLLGHMAWASSGRMLSQIRDVGIPVQVLPVAAAFGAILWFTGRSKMPREAFIPLQALYALTVLLSFTRSVWAQLALGYLLVFLFLGFGQRRRALGMALLVLPLVLFTAPILGRALASGKSLGSLVTERVVSLTQGEEDISQASRLFEGEAALTRWLASPIWGAGLGAEIQAFDPARGRMETTDFLHNSLLYYALKMGILGLLTVLWVYVAAIRGALRARAEGTGEVSLYATGVICALVPFALIGIWSGNLNYVGFSPLLGILLGINWPALAAEERDESAVEAVS
jgi:O-antigen ligase